MSKKEIDNKLGTFNKIIERIGVDKFYLEDKYIICTLQKDDYILLFELDDELKSQIQLEFADLSTNDELKKRIAILINAITNDWIKINPENEMYLSKIFSIKIENSNYDVDINRDQMPFKLLKSEYDSVFYNVNKNIVLIKKEYKSKIDGYSFNVIRGFQFI